MDDLDIHFKLLGGRPIYIEQAGYLTIPPLEKIVDINMSLYNSFLASLLIDKSMIKSDLDNNVTNFDIFYANCYHNEEFKANAFAAIFLFFSESPTLKESDDSVYIEIGKGQINHSNFNIIQKIIRLGNNVEIQNEPEFKPANSRAKKMIEMILKNRAKQPKVKEKIDLHSIVAGLAWKDNGLSLFDLYKMNIYQIYNGLYVSNNIDNYHHTITALYAGTLDGKSIKMADIHWANKLK
ncbi:hypothetical protein H6F38_13790 [Paenibacillus sp. EKM208P]|uniref:Uncharacterized protein n=1 Tax=Paenibacillus peoriae TaxID=59893 RepID=A0A7H0Y368_9BACL|nr:hypothetical protein [Paenibacillus peoriae]KAF6630502.1 hypothetical protein H6F38_13790 [Paenibacillus sp. EKM208P]QNR65526.1 hypothetical protein IAQ67_16725 [Paenibacillus peoriae]